MNAIKYRKLDKKNNLFSRKACMSIYNGSKLSLEMLQKFSYDAKGFRFESVEDGNNSCGSKIMKYIINNKKTKIYIYL